MCINGVSVCVCVCVLGSWTVLGPSNRFFFAGDTGYCSSFQEIGRRFGPFDLAAIPIGAYLPRCVFVCESVCVCVCV